MSRHSMWKRESSESHQCSILKRLQWWIQDFPAGASTPKVGVLTYYFANLFAEKLRENEGIAPPPPPWGRVRVSFCPSLDPPLKMSWILDE